MVWQAIGGIGGALVGGLFGRSSQRRAERAAERQFATRIQTTVADAKAAGIHPLAALGASTGPMPAMVNSGSPMGDAIGSAVAGLGDAYGQYRARKDQEKADAGMAAESEARVGLLRAQTRQADAEAAATAAEAQSRTMVAAARAGSVGATTRSPTQPPRDYGGGERTDPFGLRANNRLPDASRVTSRYGEPAEWVYAPIVAAADWLTQNTERWQQAESDFNSWMAHQLRRSRRPTPRPQQVRRPSRREARTGRQ